MDCFLVRVNKRYVFIIGVLIRGMINLTPREYQRAIFECARECNTLVVLPTGLGKTLVAVMLSVERLEKYPRSKVVILAPTRPLVEQHLQTFRRELPELFADMQLFTGSVHAEKRRDLFDTTDIIFSTPQCIAHDVSAGLYSLSDVSLLVVDEAHRCLKNYDYTVVVDFYKRQARQQRILGLTASPGHDAENVREICHHLNIEEIEVRTRDSDDVRDYLQRLEFEKIEVPFPDEFLELKVLLKRLWDARIDRLKQHKFLFGVANKITLLQLQQRLALRARQGDYGAMHGMSTTAQAIKIAHALELLETQTLSGLGEYLKGLVAQAREKKSRGVQQLVKSPEFGAAMISLQRLRATKMEHPKIEALAAVLLEQFSKKNDSKVIIFSQFRETALKILERVSQLEGIHAATFFGQANRVQAGLSQKEQRAIIERFREGEINVLCATSIGEEGLDIPEVSTVVFYEPIPSAIRKIQRAGRTARLAPGRLVILVTQDTRDVAHHYASRARERKMYQTLALVREELKNRRKELTLNEFGAVERT